jgi:hypothetical protein
MSPSEVSTIVPQRVAATDLYLRDLRRKFRAHKIANYDRDRVLPRVILDGLHDDDDARRVRLTPRPVILTALRQLIRHLRSTRREFYGDPVRLRAAQEAYFCERVASFKDRKTAENLRNARAA